MRQSYPQLDGLARLHDYEDSEASRHAWRQALSSLATDAVEHRPVPLEGIDPRELLYGVQAAFQRGLLEDLAWLPRPASSVALYELAAALPERCEERKELGRRVFDRLHGGDAATFTAVATRLAIGSRRSLSAQGIRARVALALDLPIGRGQSADPLALALIARPELERTWLSEPAMGSLPARRLAARLLERAAREAARRADAGDLGVLRIFHRPSVKSAWTRLLHDREPLVWRYVAAARGLLSEHDEELADEIRAALDPGLTPTDWLRGAASMAARVAVHPLDALHACEQLLSSPLMERNAGIASAMLLGLPRAIEAEPEPSEELAMLILEKGGIGAVEALLTLRREGIAEALSQKVYSVARNVLATEGYFASTDEGMVALAEILEGELPGQSKPVMSLLDQVDRARLSFVEKDAPTAFEEATAVLRRVEYTIGKLEQMDMSLSRREVYGLLRELSGTLLETGALPDLLALGAETGTSLHALDSCFDRLHTLLLSEELNDPDQSEPLPHRSFRLRRMRTLLYLIDADAGADEHAGSALAERRLSSARLLLRAVHAEPPPSLRRIMTAAAARACDALVGSGSAEISDILIAVAAHVESQDGLATMAEASMIPETREAFRAFEKVVAKSVEHTGMSRRRTRATLSALRKLVEGLPCAAAPRTEALRGALLDYTEAITSLANAGSLQQVAGERGQPSLIAPLGEVIQLLGRLVTGARRRLGFAVEEDESTLVGDALIELDFAVEQAALGDPADLLMGAVMRASGALHGSLPFHFAEVGASALEGLLKLPAEPDPSRPATGMINIRREVGLLPPWMPPSRILGGFYVLRSLGSGAGGSVFVARRIEERRDDRAPSFALKVPEYGGGAARALSEEEFLGMFRAEAGALLTIPNHENLARLVTFDAGAKPKPILVMEMVEGPTLERVIGTGRLDVARAIGIMEGITAGLKAMHEVGIGHLDIKPSNVILRPEDGQQDPKPVLVDFGLAGRRMRPGCATAWYGAPEVWGFVPPDNFGSPLPTDVYALACVLYEILTGRELVDGPSEMAIIHTHLEHDGSFPGLLELSADAELKPFAKLLASALRRDPRHRIGIGELHQRLRGSLTKALTRPWPVVPQEVAPQEAG